MARSWNAEGLIKLAWDRLGVSNGRDTLAERTGIPATNLSSINSGNKLLTLNYAERICVATGVTLAELGAPLEALSEEERSLYDLLQSALEQAERGRAAVYVSLGSIDVRLSRIEDALGLQDGQDSVDRR